MLVSGQDVTVNITIESQDQVVTGMRMEEAESSGAGVRLPPGEYPLFPLEVVNINTVTDVRSEDTFLSAPDCQYPLISVRHQLS